MRRLRTIVFNQKGLTLIELLAVIIILAIIVAIAIPTIGNVIENTRLNSVKSDAINVIDAANLYFAENPDAPSIVKVKELNEQKYLDSIGNIPDDSYVTKNLPRKFSTPENKPIIFSGTKQVSFSEVTIKEISEDTKMGSEIENDEIYVIQPK